MLWLKTLFRAIAHPLFTGMLLVKYALYKENFFFFFFTKICQDTIKPILTAHHLPKSLYGSVPVKSVSLLIKTSSLKFCTLKYFKQCHLFFEVKKVKKRCANAWQKLMYRFFFKRMYTTQILLRLGDKYMNMYFECFKIVLRFILSKQQWI